MIRIQTQTPQSLLSSYWIKSNCENKIFLLQSCEHFTKRLVLLPTLCYIKGLMFSGNAAELSNKNRGGKDETEELKWV
jgi:hypothetical protein